jgi:hypothetical protein
VAELLQSGEHVPVSDDKLERLDSGQLVKVDGVALLTEAANIAERPVVFSSKRVKRPHKRKPDIVELEAETVLKKIKANSAKEGAALE